MMLNIAAGTKFESGISLFEILITILVVSVGLLGLAGLQFTGLRAANNAQQHTLATLLAQDIEARIRANIAAAKGPTYAYNSVNLDSTSSPGAVDCVTTACTAIQMADNDLYQWYRLIVPQAGERPLLPNASIIVSSDNGTDFQTIIQWGDPSGPQTLYARFTDK
jgi:type IV pilus modification protein PilV